MITILFGFGNEKILVSIKGYNVTFASTKYGAKETSIDGLQLSHQGVIKEFPDLEDKDDWAEQAIKRFKNKVKSFTNENERADYIISDLKKHGYMPEQRQKGGFRPKSLR